MDVFGICEKNEPGRGANFIVRPRAQNCIATPLIFHVLKFLFPLKWQNNYSPKVSKELVSPKMAMMKISASFPPMG